MFNRKKIRELEEKCHRLEWENEAHKKTHEQLEKLEENRKRLEAQIYPPEEIGDVYDKLREGGAEIIDMGQPFYFNGRIEPPRFTLDQALKYKDLQNIISGAGWEIKDFFVRDKQIYFSIQKPEART